MNSSKTWILMSVLFLSLFLVNTSTHAVPVTFEFGGTISSYFYSPDDTGGVDPFAGDIYNGVAYSGSYTFNSDAADLSSSDFNGNYASSGSSYGMEFQIGDHLFSNNSVHVNVFDGLFQDRYEASTSIHFGIKEPNAAN